MHQICECALSHCHRVDLDGIEIRIQVPNTSMASHPYSKDREEQKTAEEPKFFPNGNIFQRISQHVYSLSRNQENFACLPLQKWNEATEKTLTPPLTYNRLNVCEPPTSILSTAARETLAAKDTLPPMRVCCMQEMKTLREIEVYSHGDYEN